MRQRKISLSAVNNVLLVLIICVNGYVALAPFSARVLYGLKSHKAEQAKLQSLIKPKNSTAETTPVNTPTQSNHVVIPSMGLNAPIYDGPESQQYKILNKGIWRFSYGSTPDQGGNTVLIGHRFTYTNPRGIFYFLDKVQIGDQIGVWWNNKEYVYQVATINVVDPSDTSIENRSSKPELTLFTCTPLWSPKFRMVVVAYPEANT